MADPRETIVETMVHGGDGLCRVDGQVWFVPGVVPAERVLLTPVTQRRGFVRARLEQVRDPSPDRCAAPCPLFGRCGGCHWQYMRYERQLQCKREIVRDCLRRIGKLSRYEVAPVVPSPNRWAYRSRAQFAIDRHGGVGFHRSRAHRIEPVSSCLLLHPLLNEALGWSRTELARTAMLPETAVQLDMLALTEAGAVLVGWRDSRGTLLGSGVWNPAAGLQAGTGGQHRERVNDLFCARSLGNFDQANHRQNLQMIDRVCGSLEPLPGTRICDLFCGSGNFSLPLARAGAQVTGLECNARAIEEARCNARTNTIETAEFRVADIMRATPADSLAPCDAVVVNPPRAGCSSETRALMLRLAPATIAYISCNPATLARDLAFFCARHYMIAQIEPFDMFPQTFHIETIAILQRQGAHR